MRALLLGLLLLPIAAYAQDKPKAKADPSIESLLKKLEYKYEVDGDGDYKLVFEMDDEGKRSQIVFIRSNVETFGKQKVREIWSPGYVSKGKDIPANVANMLLADSMDSIMGGWGRQDGNAMFIVRIPADAGAEQLDEAMTAAIRSADQMEAKLTPGKDEL